ncbi:hypothetical protein [Cerasicoccus arenae]|uniref:Uncharacterized protein n=1 Tax=Cerasicoccus arenae TaxID=424488 RepID=A0A8J3DES5_9BACT|nr:hypothetical protein [Cerasicoccus arenae]MBK1859481.1 hypothetical protein [Cerasicoccus arenae]GHC10891.1 hypothetical protein GCM10007047_30320 [Cerasicoccus arenae]
MAQDTQKHKTVGVSFNPELRDRASERSRSLGLSFSRYVTMCVEAELNGRQPQLLTELGAAPVREDLNLQSAIDAGSDYSAAKAASIDFEDDIEEILRDEDICYTRYSSVANLRTDFLIQHVDEKTDRTIRIALECKHNLRGRYTVTLGQAIILRSMPQIDAVVLCVPYMKNFDDHVRETFHQQDIPIATPDNVVSILRKLSGQTPE